MHLFDGGRWRGPLVAVSLLCLCSRTIDPCKGVSSEPGDKSPRRDNLLFPPEHNLLLRATWSFARRAISLLLWMLFFSGWELYVRHLSFPRTKDGLHTKYTLVTHAVVLTASDVILSGIKMSTHINQSVACWLQPEAGFLSQHKSDHSSAQTWGLNPPHKEKTYWNVVSLTFFRALVHTFYTQEEK